MTLKGHINGKKRLNKFTSMLRQLRLWHFDDHGCFLSLDFELLSDVIPLTKINS